VVLLVVGVKLWRYQKSAPEMMSTKSLFMNYEELEKARKMYFPEELQMPQSRLQHLLCLILRQQRRQPRLCRSRQRRRKYKTFFRKQHKQTKGSSAGKCRFSTCSVYRR
jgi:hypothetical protein